MRRESGVDGDQRDGKGIEAKELEGNRGQGVGKGDLYIGAGRKRSRTELGQTRGLLPSVKWLGR